MTTVTLTSSELRHSKAILLAADAGQWLRPDRLIDGRRAVGIPSQTKRGLYHWTDGVSCSCYDFRRRQQPCKHVLAHKLDAIARPQPQPASDTVDGLTHMLEQRLADEKPVLEMVREEDGDITWRPLRAERRELDRILGKTPPVYETDHAAASKYDDVFKRFDDDGPRSVQKESYL